VGSDAPGKCEVDPSLLELADLLVADSPRQSRERGEFQACPPHRTILSLREALGDPSCHRRRGSKEGAATGEEDEGDDRLVVFDTSGLALQDCVIATLVASEGGDFGPRSSASFGA
jgi:ornithine cyclodeaminase